MSLEESTTSGASNTTSSSNSNEEVLLLARLRAQVEFYFSPQNLSRDVFLRQQFYGDCCPLMVVSQFPKVRELTSAKGMDPLYWIRQSLINSSVVQISPDGQWLRPIQPLPPLEQHTQPKQPPSEPQPHVNVPMPSSKPVTPAQPPQQRVVLNNPPHPAHFATAVPYPHPIYPPPYMYAHPPPQFYHHPPPLPQNMGFTYMNAVGHRNYFGPNYTIPRTNNNNNFNTNNSNNTRFKNQKNPVPRTNTSNNNPNKNNTSTTTSTTNNNNNDVKNSKNNSTNTNNNNNNKTSSKRQPRMKQRNSGSQTNTKGLKSKEQAQQQQAKPTKDIMLGTDHFPALPSSAAPLVTSSKATKAGYADALRQTSNNKPNTSKELYSQDFHDNDDLKLTETTSNMDDTANNYDNCAMDENFVEVADDLVVEVDEMMSKCQLLSNSDHTSTTTADSTTQAPPEPETTTTTTTTIAVGALTGTKTKTEIKQLLDEEEKPPVLVQPVVNIINHSEPTPKEAADGTKKDTNHATTNQSDIVSNPWGDKPSFIDVVRKKA